MFIGEYTPCTPPFSLQSREYDDPLKNGSQELFFKQPPVPLSLYREIRIKAASNSVIQFYFLFIKTLKTTHTIQMFALHKPRMLSITYYTLLTTSTCVSLNGKTKEEVTPTSPSKLVSSHWCHQERHDGAPHLLYTFSHY